MSKPNNTIRQALVSARAVLLTCSHDTPEDLKNPARARVLAQRVEMLTEALAEFDTPAKHEVDFTDEARASYGRSVMDHFHK